MPKRRANGEGSIFKRRDGLWAAQYTDNTGKKRTLYGKTQQEVKQKLKEAIRQTDIGIYTDKEKMTFVQWLYEWLEVYIKPSVRLRTYSMYYYNIKNHIAPYFGKILLKDLRPDMVQKFINVKAVSGRLDGNPGGLGISVLKDFKKTINAALSQAEENNMIVKNVCTHVKLPKEEQKEKEILSVDEQKKLEQVAMNDYSPQSFAILLALYTGLRVGELVSLTLDDIDLDEKLLYVRRTLSATRDPDTGKFVNNINEPKTRKGRRVIPLSDFLVDLLKVYIDDRNELVTATNGRWRGSTEETAAVWRDKGYLFLSVYGLMSTDRNMRKLLIRLLKEAGVRHVTFHALRHTFATRSIENGFDIKTLADILGHEDPSITLRIYAHALDDQKKANMDKLTHLYNQDLDDDE